jgi:hypothetical protein
MISWSQDNNFTAVQGSSSLNALCSQKFIRLLDNSSIVLFYGSVMISLHFKDRILKCTRF